MRNGPKKHGGSSRERDTDSNEASESDDRFSMEMVARRSSEAKKQIVGWRDKLARQAKDHPGRSIAIAIGAGYLLGGGLFSRLTARLIGTGVRVGLRLAVVPFVTQGIVSLGEGLLDRGPDDVGGDDSSTEARTGARQNQNHSDQKETHS